MNLDVHGGRAHISGRISSRSGDGEDSAGIERNDSDVIGANRHRSTRNAQRNAFNRNIIYGGSGNIEAHCVSDINQIG